MIKVFFIINMMWASTMGRDESFTAGDRLELLTGSSQKSWYLHSITPGIETGSCSPSSAMALDNRYIFFADGSFEFDRGAIVEDPTCQGTNCCTDLINLVGTWKFTNFQKGLRVVTRHEKNNEENVMQEVLCNGTIEQLDEEVLKVSQLDSETNSRLIFEFRKSITY